MIHNDVARRTVRNLFVRSLAPRRSPAYTLCRDHGPGTGDPTTRTLVRDLEAARLTRRTEGGRLDAPTEGRR